MTSVKRTGPGRPPDPEIEARVFTATLDEYAVVGWAGFTIDAVARRSRVGKAAIYRRWSSKEDLIVAAIDSLGVRRPFPISESVRGDLLEMAERVAARYLGPNGLAYLRAQVEAKVYPEILGEALDRLRQATIAGGRRHVVAGIERGELPEGTSPALVMDALAGTIAHRFLFIPESKRTQLAANPAPFVEQVVDFVLAGAGWNGPPANSNGTAVKRSQSTPRRSRT